MSENTHHQIKLPESLIGSADLSKVIRDLQSYDEAIRQADLRKTGHESIKPSNVLHEVAHDNHVSLNDAAQREQLQILLTAFRQHAPRIHMGLASDPSAKFTHNIIVWMRKNIHPLVLLEIGLQPAIAAGCTIRTQNKFFDLSLRNHFTDSRPLLVQKIKESADKAESALIAEALQASHE